MNIFKKGFNQSILFMLFLVSGFCGLLYQIVWVRLAFAAFGIITPVLSVVISVFMLGLALGSWLGGRYIGVLTRRTGLSAILFYALAEFIIGIGGLLVPVLFSAGQMILLPTGDFNSSRYLLLSAFVLGVSILPWCVCMGTTVPLMLAFFKQFNSSNTKGFSYLYLANVIGAMLGTMVTAGFLIELIGLHRTLLIAVCFNFCIAIIALILNFRYQSRKQLSTVDEISLNVELPSAPKPVRFNLILLILFITGFVSMAMEVIWTRAFTPILSTTIYAFAAILTVYLLATWVGSWFYRLHARNSKVLRTSDIIAGLAYLCFLPIVFSDPRIALSKSFMRSLIPLSSIFPFCAALGYLLPKLVDELSHGDPKIAGRAYAINTLGCILGPLFAGYILLPFVGVRFSVILLAIPFIGLLVYYFKALWLQNYRHAFFSVFLSSVLLIGSAGTFLSFEDTIFYRSAVLRRDYVATVISSGEGMGKQLYVDGIGMTHLTPITKCMAHLPLAIRGKKPESALVICLGMGTTFRSAASWDIKTTAVELVPSVRDAFGFYFDDAEEILKKPNVKIIVDDGRRFLRRTQEKFDMIAIDPPPPVTSSGSGFLYSEEFYGILKERLKEGGILQQWLPYGDDVTISAVTRAISVAFPFLRIFNSMEGWGYHFIASMQPFDMPSMEEFMARLPASAAADFVEWNKGEDAGMLYREVTRREIPLKSVLAYGPTLSITDDRPLNEYFLVRRVSKILTGKLSNGD